MAAEKDPLGDFNDFLDGIIYLPSDLNDSDETWLYDLEDNPMMCPPTTIAGADEFNKEEGELVMHNNTFPSIKKATSSAGEPIKQYGEYHLGGTGRMIVARSQAAVGVTGSSKELGKRKLIVDYKFQ
jgi:hypothetical protein